MTYKDSKNRKIYNQKYQREHKEEIRERKRKYYEQHREWFAARNKEWRLNNSERRITYNCKYVEAIKTKVLSYYADGIPKCKMCGESRLACLSIDHIEGNGNIHRREINSHGGKFYRWLRNKGFPPGYQVLCMNCQFVKRYQNKENRRVSHNESLQARTNRKD